MIVCVSCILVSEHRISCSSLGKSSQTRSTKALQIFQCISQEAVIVKSSSDLDDIFRQYFQGVSWRPLTLYRHKKWLYRRKNYQKLSSSLNQANSFRLDELSPATRLSLDDVYNSKVILHYCWLVHYNYIIYLLSSRFNFQGTRNDTQLCQFHIFQ